MTPFSMLRSPANDTREDRQRVASADLFVIIVVDASLGKKNFRDDLITRKVELLAAQIEFLYVHNAFAAHGKKSQFCAGDKLQ